MPALLWAFMCFAGGVAMSDNPDLAEDPLQMKAVGEADQAVHPWRGRSREALQDWARQNLHHKLTARSVYRDEDHPEWSWFRRSGLGIFLHWGPASLPPGNGDAWAMMWNEGRVAQGRNVLPEQMFAAAESWSPSAYDPDAWLEAAAKAGFGYAVLTTRHHDGYCLWPSAHGEWDTGEHMSGRDLVKDYVEACRKHGLRVGFYYSGPNWHFDYKKRDFSHPAEGYNYLHQKVEGLKTPADLLRKSDEESAGQVQELMTRYGPIDMMWWDGNSIMTEEELKALQPDIFVARGNIATPEGRHHGESRNVKVTNEAGWWWELCIKTEKKDTPYWHYNPVLETNRWSANDLLTELIRCRSLGGNLLANIPPRPNGEMMDWFYLVCNEMAGWMQHSREAVQDVDLNPPLPTLDKTDNYTTVRGNAWYALPDDGGQVLIREVERPDAVTLLRTGEPLEFSHKEGVLRLMVPESLRTNLPDLVKIVFADDDA